MTLEQAQLELGQSLPPQERSSFEMFVREDERSLRLVRVEQMKIKIL
jgi:hypothetical protein